MWPLAAPTGAVKEAIDDLTALKSTNVGETPTNLPNCCLYLFSWHDTAADTLINVLTPAEGNPRPRAGRSARGHIHFGKGGLTTERELYKQDFAYGERRASQIQHPHPHHRRLQIGLVQHDGG